MIYCITSCNFIALKALVEKLQAATDIDTATCTITSGTQHKDAHLHCSVSHISHIIKNIVLSHMSHILTLILTVTYPFCVVSHTSCNNNRGVYPVCLPYFLVVRSAGE